MKVLLLLQRNYTKQFSIDEWAKQTECRTIVVDLPDISDDRARKDPIGIGEWQIVGYEEIEANPDSEEEKRCQIVNIARKETAVSVCSMTATA